MMREPLIKKWVRISKKISPISIESNQIKHKQNRCALIKFKILRGGLCLQPGGKANNSCIPALPVERMGAIQLSSTLYNFYTY